MSRISVGLCCLVGLFFCLLCSAYGGDSDIEKNEGLFAAVGLNNLFQPQVATGKEEEQLELKWGGFGQFKYAYDDNAPETFNVMRMRLNLTGNYDFLTFFAQVDTESPSSLLLDYWVNFSCPKYKKEFNLKAGRFTVPFGWQVSTSPYELLTINYSQIVTRLFGMDPLADPDTGWDNLRDQGFYFHGVVEPKFTVGKEFKPTVGYVAGFVNGESRATDDTNESKAGMLRVYVTPNVAPEVNFTLGFSYYDGSRFYATDPLTVGIIPVPLAANGREFSHRLQGIDWKFEMLDGRLLIQGEFIHAEINPADEGKHETTPSVHYKANHTDGWFVEVGYKLDEVSEKLQVVGKVDVMDLPIREYDPATTLYDLKVSGANRLRTYGLGANYYINKFSKLQVIWEHKDDEGKQDRDANDKATVLLGVKF